MTTVYIAGPLGKSAAVRNVQKAMKAANELMENGIHFYIPHMMFYMDRYFNHSYETWMKEDEHWINKCDVMLRLPGDSPGADREVKYAIQHKIPVFTTIEEVISYHRKQVYAAI